MTSKIPSILCVYFSTFVVELIDFLSLYSSGRFGILKNAGSLSYRRYKNIMFNVDNTDVIN